MTTKKEQRAAEIEARKIEAFSAKVRRLTGQLVSQRLAEKIVRAAYDAGKTADAFAAEIAAREPVGRVVHPLKADAVKWAGDAARARVERVRAELEAADWKINAVAPYPDSRGMSREAYLRAKARYSLFSTLTKEDEVKRAAYYAAAPAEHPERGAYLRADPKPVRMSQWGVDRFVSTAEEMAAAEYDAFICKLVAKVGDCDDASLDGSHVWAHSILTVRKGDVVENWKTQQITNWSSLGNPYPQWPTRIVK
jgi:hypothetical protein